jgi:phosphatidylethanolamine-binding protein (PEBP) family uncharacterized protein
VWRRAKQMVGWYHWLVMNVTEARRIREQSR